MKKNYILIFSGVLMVGALSMQKTSYVTLEKYIAKNAHKYSGGSPAGKTGAPGEEPACTACHGGSTQSGITENNFILLDGINPTTNYLPGNTYSVALTMSSNPTKKGFQATAWTSGNVMAGSFTGQAGNTAISTAVYKMYANHTSSSMHRSAGFILLKDSPSPAWHTIRHSFN